MLLDETRRVLGAHVAVGRGVGADRVQLELGAHELVDRVGAVCDMVTARGDRSPPALATSPFGVEFGGASPFDFLTVVALSTTTFVFMAIG